MTKREALTVMLSLSRLETACNVSKVNLTDMEWNELIEAQDILRREILEDEHCRNCENKKDCSKCIDYKLWTPNTFVSKKIAEACKSGMEIADTFGGAQ